MIRSNHFPDREEKGQAMAKEQFFRRSLDGGIHLNFVENDRYKTNTITFYFLTPLDRTRASYNTVLSRMLTRGCEKYPTQLLLNRALDSAYDATLEADAVKLGEWHSLSLTMTLLDNAFAFDGLDVTEAGLSILEESLFRPYLPNGLFSPDAVKSECQLAIDEIDACINQKARYARERLTQIMCRLEPYGTNAAGDKRVIRRITPESLTAYYREWLASARAEIFFVGRFDRERVTERVAKAFRGLERKEAALPEISIRTKAKSVREVTETMPVAQANLAIGFRTGTTVFDKQDMPAFSLYNSVLGGSLTSKLFTVLREKMSLCYSVASYPDALKGVMTVYAGIAPENREVAIREALAQMEEIRKGNITAEELENARGAILHSLRSLADNPPALADWYLARALTDRLCSPEEVCREIRAVRAEDVVRVAERVTLDTVYTLMPEEV